MTETLIRRTFGIGTALLGLFLGGVSTFGYCQLTTAAVTGKVPIPDVGTAFTFAVILAVSIFLTIGGYEIAKD